MKLNLKHSPYHVVLFAVFPLLFLYANNIHIVSARELILPLTLSISFSILAWFVLKLILKNSNKSAIITSVFLVLFFMYGHTFVAFNGIELEGFDTARHSHFVIPFVAIFCVAAYLTIRTKRKLDNTTAIGNAMAVALVAMSLANVGVFEFQYTQTGSDFEPILSASNQQVLSDLPNIYYIILDGYADADTLHREYDFDNSDFINYLNTNDFVIPSKTHANYPSTFLSIPTSLNMQYIHYQPGFDADEPTADRSSKRAIHNNVVMRELKASGYTIVNFDSGWWLTERNRFADFNLCQTNTLNSEFMGVVVRTTMLNPIHVMLFEFDTREGILCIFDELSQINGITSEPVFVFAHVIIPHPPYLFDKDGKLPNVDSLSLTSGWGDHEKYLGQLQFANMKVKDTIVNILSREKDSIIIIQADHGPRDIDWDEPDANELKTALGILNAYHFPNGGDEKIYESITPVNSFRVLFDHYFDANYGLLEDRAYFSSNSTARYIMSEDVSSIIQE